MGLSPDALYNAAYLDVLETGTSASFEAVPFPGCTYRQYASDYLLHSIIRKWIPKDTTNADKNALDTFISANNRCRAWKLPLMDTISSILLGEIRRNLDDFFHPGGVPLISSYFDLLKSGRPGPGVSVGAMGTSYYSKYFSSPLASTSMYLYEEYRRYGEWIPFLSDAECQRYEKFGSPLITSGSRCSFVPKTASTSRMICVEPSLNMFYQLGLATILEERLRSCFNIDLRTQPQENHRLAREGSLNGSFATIDLSSASDSISLGLCEALLPNWFFTILCNLRSRTTEINGNHVPLYMISTMGNGFTFPLQTIIFGAILKACHTVFGTYDDKVPWSVFGDDLICRSNCYDRVVSMLTLLGFSINASKSFNTGPFRESCGADWFYGQPVRPVFIRKLDTPYDVFVAINQLNEWTAYTGIPLKNVVSLLLSTLGRKFITYVPFDSAMDSGLRVPLKFIRPRYNKNLSFMYYTWERVSQSIQVCDGEFRVPGKVYKDLQFNPSGLYCSFLFGELVSLKIMVRHNRKIFRRKLRCSPFWDYIPVPSLSNGVRLGWQQWETAVDINLSKSR